MPRDYYEVLGVSRDADETTIKKSFRRLARELHPDVNAHDPDAESKFKEAAEAYEVLSDTERRRMYDAYGHEGLKTGGYQPDFESFGSIGDLFSAFFGAGGFDAAFGTGRNPRGGSIQGGDIAVAAPIDLADAAHGTRPATAPARRRRSLARASASSCERRSATPAAATAGWPSSPAAPATGAACR